MGVLKKRYTTKEVCEAFGISKGTLFRWESEKLLSGVERDWRNWRLYSEDNMRQIRRMMTNRSDRSKN